MKSGLILIGLMMLVALPIIAQDTVKPVKTQEAETSDTISVLFGVAPKGLKVNVFYGKKKLGETPFEYEFPRNSGPVDIVFKRKGYFNVNTRVFTYDDSKLIVKMTKLSEASQLHGYKEEIPPDAGLPDGVPVIPSADVTPTSLPNTESPVPPTPETP